MSDQATSGPSADPDPGVHPVEELPPARRHRVVRSEDLPRFSIGTPIAVGIVIWLVLLAAAIWQRDQLQADGNGWWIWTAVTGVVLGLLGWLYTLVRLKDQPGQVVDPAPAPPD